MSRPQNLVREKVPIGNPNDVIRDAILRHLYELHSSARGPKAVGTGIRDLQKAMKTLGFSQAQVTSNLDYLLQKGWVREVVTPRSFTTARGTTQQSEVHTYKISDVGIDKLEAASAYRREEHLSRINVTTIQGVTVIGEGNVVNTQLAELSRALAELERAVIESADLSNEDKLNVIADLGAIQSQLQKPNPDRTVMKTLWSAVEKTVTAVAFAHLLANAASLMASVVS